MSAPAAHRAGVVVIAGRPNVGKSTLINRLVGAKLSITSRKAQTTRHRILGVRSDADAQYVLVDTPGHQSAQRNAMGRRMQRNLTDSVAGADVALLVAEAQGFRAGDAQVAALLPAALPVVLALNKSDLRGARDKLLPTMATAGAVREFAALVPISAKSGAGVESLLAALREHLAVAPPLYDAETLTDRPSRFFAAELIREKIFRLSGAEVPYGVDVAIDRFVEEDDLARIDATIVVDRPGHKAILLGAKGERMKRIASEARLDMEKMFGTRVFLSTWIKVRGGWADDAALLRSLGYA
jgi:GTP-binding protein Era